MISTDALRLVNYGNQPGNGWQQQLAALQQQARTFIDGLSLRPASVSPAPYVPTSYLPPSYVPQPIALPQVPVPPPLPPVPPPPPPPPPPRVEAVPYRPIPPGGAAYVMEIPPVGPDGRRQTVNIGLNDNDTLWHFRSGWNVAALNCLDAEHQPILDGYGAFLRTFSRKLSATNTAIDAQFRRQYSTRNEAVKARETYMTAVYNYFALPPARADFCNVALQFSNEFLATPPSDVNQFAATNLARIDAVFEQFFRSYDQYRIDSAAWDTRYGAQYGASQPGYVAVHSIGEPSVGASLTASTAPELAGEVVDPDTGARIPVLPVDENTVTTPVVQPVPDQPQPAPGTLRR